MALCFSFYSSYSILTRFIACVLILIRAQKSTFVESKGAKTKKSRKKNKQKKHVHRHREIYHRVSVVWNAKCNWNAIVGDSMECGDVPANWSKLCAIQGTWNHAFSDCLAIRNCSSYSRKGERERERAARSRASHSRSHWDCQRQHILFSNCASFVTKPTASTWIAAKGK